MEEPEEADYADTDMVRVSIVMETASTVGAGFATEDIAHNNAAMSYRAGLVKEQSGVQAKIEKATGEKLDVVWNLTLAANIISANVAYGQIPALEKIPGLSHRLDRWLHWCWQPGRHHRHRYRHRPPVLQQQRL